MRPIRAAAVLVLVPLAAAVCRAQAPAPAPATKIPVLLITLDTTRADRLGCYGNKDGLTRNLDALAESCTVFRNAQAAIPQTVPSHTTIMSGLDPIRHGVRKNLEVRVPSGIPLLAEEFKSAGYETGAFISSFVLLGQYGMGRGFGTYDDGFYERGRDDSNERIAPETLRRAIPWLLGQKGPYFCWIHLYDPHFPYTAPEAYAKKYPGRPYDAEVAFMDTSLGLLFQKLDQAGLLDKALVVVCGDHGESLGEHGELTHSIFLYDATTRVPLMVKLPGQSGRRDVDRDVGLVDLAATLRALCGLPAKESDGVSLVPLLTGGTFSRGPVYLESLEALYSYGWAPLYGAVDARAKYILAPRPELYRLDADPGEKTNLAPKEAAESKRLRSWVQGRVEKAVQAAPTEKIKLDAEELRSLTSLGYIAGTTGASGAPRGNYRDAKDLTDVMRDAAEAERLIQTGQFEAAARLLERVIQRDPTNPIFHFQLGSVLESSDPARSEASLKKAIQLRPTMPQAYSRLMVLWFNQNRSSEAYQLGKIGMEKVDDYNGEIHALTGYAALKAGRPTAEVEAILDEAAKRGPEFPVALKARALLALQKGDKEAAMRALLKMAEDAPPPYITQIEGDERFAPLREDPRFWTMILTAKKKMGGP